MLPLYYNTNGIYRKQLFKYDWFLILILNRVLFNQCFPKRSSINPEGRKEEY